MRPHVTPKTSAELGTDVVYTYRYLRGGMVALLLMLVFSVAFQVVVAADGCVLGSISAYYFTPARTVLVGALFALGALLIVNKARSHEEDVLLDFSGVMAFVVAMVPTVPDTSCPGSATMPASDAADAVRNSIWALVVVILVSVAVRALVRRRIGHEPRTSTGGRVATFACGTVLVVELGFFLAARDSFIALSHGIAAVTMVLGIIAVMLFNALNQRPGDPRAERFRRLYLGIAAALAVSLAVTVALHLWVPGFRYLVIVVELLVIVLFATFWVVQTIELWQKEPEELREQIQEALPRTGD